MDTLLQKLELRAYRALHRRAYDLVADSRQALDGKEVKVIIDVGANVGQTAQRFQEGFPGATIHSFEPVKASYEAGKAATAPNSSIVWHANAVGNSSGTVKFYSSGMSQFSSLAASAPDPARGLTECNEVDIIRIDDFCASNGISYVSVLKTDTEGFDLDVLKGAEKLLTENGIGCVICEVGFSRVDKSHSNFSEISEYLERFDFRLYQIYGMSDKEHFETWGYTYADALFARRLPR